MSKDGMHYAPEMKPAEVVERGEFVFAASHFDHGHIYGQVEGIHQAGGFCKYIYEPREEKLRPIRALLDSGTRLVSTFEEILEDPAIQLVTSAAIPDERCALGLQVMGAGKHYLTDKSPFTTLEQLAQARQKVAETNRKYMVCYSERLCNESAYYAGELVAGGAIGRILQVLNLAPHNLSAQSRPEWFFQKERYGGILTDIGSHQFEQFLTYTGAKDGSVTFARVENFANPQYPGLEDFGEASLHLDSGASAYCRLDWFNPAGSKVWGDGRTFILGERGYIELRKYLDLATENGGNRLLLVDEKSTQVIPCQDRVGFPFFGNLILDILNNTENAMTQDHAFKAAELSMIAQQMADQAHPPS